MYFRVNFEVRSGYGGPFLLVNAPPKKCQTSGTSADGLGGSRSDWVITFVERFYETFQHMTKADNFCFNGRFNG